MSDHPTLKPLQDVLDKREEGVKEVAKEAVRDRKETGKDVAKEITKQLKDAYIKTKENMAEYALQVEGGLDEDNQIHEAELFRLAQDVSEKEGVEIKDVLHAIGLEAKTSYTEFSALDAGEYVNAGEIREATSNPKKTETPIDGKTLNKRLLSIYKEYPEETQGVTTPEGLKKFLVDKWNGLRDKAVLSFRAEANPVPVDKSVTEAGAASGLEKMLSFGQGETLDPDVAKFFAAIKPVLGKIDHTEWKNPSEMERTIQRLIQEISDNETKKEDLSKYPNAVKNEDLGTKDKKNITKVGRKLISEMMERVPENFHNTSFESDYEGYLEGKAREGHVGKDFDEWLDERPKKSGISGMLEGLNVSLTKQFGFNVGKLVAQFFGADSFIGKMFGKLFGKEEAVEDAEADEAFKEQKKFKSRRAYEQNKLAEEMVAPSEIKALAWEGVNIKDITVEKGSPNVSAITTKNLEDLGKVLAPTATCRYATKLPKDKELTLEDLTWINDKGTVSDEEGFKVDLGGSEGVTKISYDAEEIKKARDILDGGDLEKQVGKDNMKHFDSKEALDNECFVGSQKTFENLKPVLKSLLEDVAHEKIWGDYQLTEKDINLLLNDKGDKFDEDKVFEEVRDCDEYHIIEGGEVVEKEDQSKRTVLEVNGSSFWGDYKFKDVETFFAWLKN